MYNRSTKFILYFSHDYFLEKSSSSQLYMHFTKHADARWINKYKRIVPSKCKTFTLRNIERINNNALAIIMTFDACETRVNVIRIVRDSRGFSLQFINPRSMNYSMQFEEYRAIPFHLERYLLLHFSWDTFERSRKTAFGNGCICIHTSVLLFDTIHASAGIV